MKEYIKQIISEAADSLQAKNLVREYLQARILQFLQERGVFREWIFHGGTALRFLYRLPRYSEDLDFALKCLDVSADFEGIVSKISPWFEAEAYKINLRIRDDKTVKSVFISFPGLLYDLNLSTRQSEAFSIKIELDSHPPAGGITDASVIRRYIILNIMHYDKASMLSGKLHALLARPFIKGRDLYDIFWYLSDPSWPKPNIEFLKNALIQTGWNGPDISRGNWARILAEKLNAIDWRRAVEDVRPFMERASDINMMTKENVLRLLHRLEQQGPVSS
jgi:predicted nucleotidyltransferase component of viral defense system